MSHCLAEARVKLISIIPILNKRDTYPDSKIVLIMGIKKKISTNFLCSPWKDFFMCLKKELSSINQIFTWFVLSSVSSTVHLQPVHTQFRSFLPF